MAQAKARSLTFTDYMAYDDGSDTVYDLLSNGDLVAVPNESALNDYLARLLMLKLSAVVDLRLIIVHSLTMEVEPIGDNYKNRRPDLVVLEGYGVLAAWLLGRECRRPAQIQLSFFEFASLRRCHYS